MNAKQRRKYQRGYLALTKEQFGAFLEALNGIKNNEMTLDDVIKEATEVVEQLNNMSSKGMK